MGFLDVDMTPASPYALNHTRLGVSTFTEVGNMFYLGHTAPLPLWWWPTPYDNPASWALRDQTGAVVALGGPFTASNGWPTPAGLSCGWYRLYLFNTSGDVIGGGSFIITRDVAGMAPVPQNSANFLLRAHFAPWRLTIHDAANPTVDYPEIGGRIGLQDAYRPYDPARPKHTLVSFPNGLTSASGVTQAVADWPTVDYWEGMNEPGGVPDAGFVPTMQAFQAAVKAGNPNAKALGPCGVEIGAHRHAKYRSFFGAGGGDYCDVISFHTYNLHLGDLHMGRRLMDEFVALLADYGQHTKPRAATEAGTFLAAEYGAGNYMRQAVQTMLDVLLLEQYGVDKESYWYFYPKSHGFDSCPSWLMNEGGSLYPVVGCMLTHGQELLGTTWEARHDFGTACNDFVIGSSYRRSDSTGVVSVMTAGNRAHDVTYAVTGGSPASLFTVDTWGNETTTAVVGGQCAVTATTLPTYLRLPAGVTLTPVAATWVNRNAGAVATCSAGSRGTTQIASIVDGSMPNSLYYGHGNIDGNTTSHWQSGSSTFPQTVTLTLPESRTIDTVVVHCPPPWQDASSVIQEATLEALVGGSWVQIGVINETPLVIPAKTTKHDGVNGYFDSWWRDEHVFELSFAAVTTSQVRLTVSRVSAGAQPTVAAYQAFGATDSAGHPVMAGMGTSTPWMAMQSLYLYATSPGAPPPPPPVAVIDVVEHAGELTRRFRAGQLGEGTDMPGQETLYVTAGDIESLQEDHYATVDPTGVTVYFGTSTSSEVAPTNWTAGAWSGTWSSTTKLATAVSPTLGATGATITIAAGSTVVLWVKFTVSSETVVEPVGTVVAK